MTWLQALRSLRRNDIFLNILGSAIVAFGVYNIHDVADITEGGILGLDLLLRHWFAISPAVTQFVLTAACFFLGWRVLGKVFLCYSAFAVSAFSVFYRILEHTPRLFPAIAAHPWSAALLGACFVGIGAGLGVSAGGAQSGDDALAMALNQRFGIPIERVYLISDCTVLLLSASYLSLQRLLCSLCTVILSGHLVALVVRLRKKT